ncbi:MAG: hypothetical protein RIK87_05385 [Fuerstiella sp.]
MQRSVSSRALKFESVAELGPHFRDAGLDVTAEEPNMPILADECFATMW